MLSRGTTLIEKQSAVFPLKKLLTPPHVRAYLLSALKLQDDLRLSVRTGLSPSPVRFMSAQIRLLFLSTYIVFISLIIFQQSYYSQTAVDPSIIQLFVRFRLKSFQFSRVEVIFHQLIPVSVIDQFKLCFNQHFKTGTENF